MEEVNRLLDSLYLKFSAIPKEYINQTKEYYKNSQTNFLSPMVIIEQFGKRR